MSSLIQFFILVFVAPVLFMVLGTILGILLTLLRTDRLKLKVFLLIVLRPVMYSLILTLVLRSWFLQSWIYVLIVASGTLLINLFSGKTKFLSRLIVCEDGMTIGYLDAFLQKRTIQIRFADISNLALTKVKSAANYPTSLRFCIDEDQETFIILNKNIWASAKNALQDRGGSLII